jgi:hypothetical protein
MSIRASDVHERGWRHAQHSGEWTSPPAPFRGAVDQPAAENAVSNDTIVEQRVRAKKSGTALTCSGARPQHQRGSIAGGVNPDRG